MTLAPPKPVEERLYTAEELLAMPGDARFELVEGKPKPMAPAGDAHGESTIRLSGRLFIYVDDNDLGSCRAAETGFIVARDPDMVLAPDFSFMRKDRLGYPRGKGYVPIAPDFVVEARSPGDRQSEIAEKVSRWLSYGVTVVIDSDPARKVLIVHRQGVPPVVLRLQDTLTIPDLLPGFSLPVNKVF